MQPVTSVNFVSSILIFRFRDRTLESERLREFLCAHFEDFCFAFERSINFAAFQISGARFPSETDSSHSYTIAHLIALPFRCSVASSRTLSRYCGILASRWGCPDTAYHTEKNDPDELRTIDWTMSDCRSDAKIEFVYFGLRERVIGIGFAMVCLRGVSAQLGIWIAMRAWGLCDVNVEGQPFEIIGR
jgi:hypothetical protein